MNKFHAIAVTPTKMGFTLNYIEFAANTENFSVALCAFVEKFADKYGDCYFLSADDYSPITFDCTVQLMGGLNKPFASDQFATTYNKFAANMSDMAKQDNFVSMGGAFCRIIKGEGGKAGEFFTFHDPDFGRFRADPKAPFAEHGIFNEPKFYFENRK